VDGEQSDSDTLLRRDVFWCFSSGGAITQAGFREFGSRGHAITVSARLCFFGSGTFVVHNDLSRLACPRSKTSRW